MTTRHSYVQYQGDAFAKCDMCNSFFNNITSWEEHNRLHHHSDPSPRIVSNNERQIEEYNSHGNRYECFACDNTYKYKFMLECHMSKKHNIRRQQNRKNHRYFCIQCGMEQKTLADLKVHQNLHISGIPVICVTRASSVI
ncbi:zinc finger protein 501-like [Pseudomyrmex gracilis]|uniref:zinc finger protein 501-like n=1 Tax=Pseudomyrmex gracilis TaxID=219809 RepID=UPI00099531D0|nr:zinc finger protein 501-like [Pseudomyrmex gracilis]